MKNFGAVVAALVAVTAVSFTGQAQEQQKMNSQTGFEPKLKAGDTAPAFTLLDQEGKKISLADYKGKNVLVYFYPKADTPGCTKQACSIRDSSKDLAGKDVAALGISPDVPEDQKKFDMKYTLGFPLLCDTEHAVAKAYGTWGKKNRGGQTVEGIIRSSFLIDGDGKIVETWYQVSPEDTVPNAMEELAKK